MRQLVWFFAFLTSVSDVSAQPSPYAFSPTTFVPPSVRTSTTEQYTKLAFELAETVALVEVDAVVDGQIELHTVEVLRGYATPASFRLWEVGDVDPRDYPKGSRWFLAADAHQRKHTPIELLPANAVTAASVREWSVPGWQRSPNVLVLRLWANDPDRRLLTFDVVERLRGSYNDAQLRVFVSLYDRMFKSYRPGEALYVAGTFGSSYGSTNLYSLDPVTDKELPGVERVLAADPFGQLQAMLRWETKDMELIETAWRFARAPIVAEVEVSRIWQEPSGAGGTHITLAPVRVLRGEVPDVLPQTSPGGTLMHAPPDRGLFYAGGHAYWGGEAMGERFLAAGHGVGYHATIRLPATPENRRLIEFFLRQEPASLRLLPNSSRPDTSVEMLGDDRDLFHRSVALRASLTRRRWASLEVVDARRGEDTWVSLREVEFYGALGGSSRTNWDKVGIPTWEFRFRTGFVPWPWSPGDVLLGCYLAKVEGNLDPAAFVPGTFLRRRWVHGGDAIAIGGLDELHRYLTQIADHAND